MGLAVGLVLGFRPGPQTGSRTHLRSAARWSFRWDSRTVSPTDLRWGSLALGLADGLADGLFNIRGERRRAETAGYIHVLASWQARSGGRWEERLGTRDSEEQKVFMFSACQLIKRKSIERRRELSPSALPRPRLNPRSVRPQSWASTASCSGAGSTSCMAGSGFRSGSCSRSPSSSRS